MPQTLGYAAQTPKAPLAPYRFARRAPRPQDVEIDVLYCGVCHSDLHQVRDDWGRGLFPMVPGHEIIGRVRAIGSAVTRFKVGDQVGVGCIVDACSECGACGEGLEQYCEQGFVPTYNGLEKDGQTRTYGGYATDIVVDQAFVLRVPERLDGASAAPLLCAGITTYSPLRHFGVTHGQRVGVVGLGGLGHMAIKFARSLGAEVVVFTTSPEKAEDAKRLGATDVVVGAEKAELRRQRGRLDLIVDTVAAPHDLNRLVSCLRRDGTLALVGMPDSDHPALKVAGLVVGRRRVAGSFIGGIRETQEMLDYCAEHAISADIERIPMQDINEAYERMLKGNVRYRFVIDMASLREG